MKILIKNGRVIDPAYRHDAVADVAIEDGKVMQVGQGIDAAGCTLAVAGRHARKGVNC